jgi:hypothetical protein
MLALATQITLHHNILRRDLGRAVHWVGITSTLDPLLR